YLAEANPMKLASFEALWETENPAPFAVVADINQEAVRNDFEILIPKMFSFMVHNSFSGEVKGINDLQREAVEKYGSGYYIPNDVRGMFWSFRAMVGSGGALLLIVFVTGVLVFFCRDKIREHYCCLKLMPILLPLPFIANSAGWYIAEAGRQPWIVVGLQKTAVAVSPNLSAGEVWITLIGFTAIYLFLAVLAVFAAVMFIRRTKITSEE
ncbi:MAG: cytochrome ubiquinol oxidase subunit I, partial [Selenomonadaceae bacterium]|nr:cytochrome ubiquinol oxidase subunit I [Selenomonadaceae bacterium]